LEEATLIVQTLDHGGTSLQHWLDGLTAKGWGCLDTDLEFGRVS